MYSDICGYSPEWLNDAGRFLGGLAILVLAGTVTIVTSPLLLVPILSSVPLITLNMAVYGRALMSSAFNDTVKNDMDKIGWNPFNNDLDSVKSSTNISFYKGTAVFRVGDVSTPYGFSCGAIFLGRHASSDTILHEYGHIKQQRLLGMRIYSLGIMLPSVISFHTSSSLYDHMNRWYEKWATDWGKGGLIWW